LQACSNIARPKLSPELHLRASDDLLELGLACSQRQLPEVAAVQIEEVERDEDDGAGELPLRDRRPGTRGARS
jgi:hypothetical protein